MSGKTSKGKLSGGKNPERRNGKAWKKGADGVSAAPEKRVVKRKSKTLKRLRKDLEIQSARDNRRTVNIVAARLRKAADLEIAIHLEAERNGLVRIQPIDTDVARAVTALLLH